MSSLFSHFFPHPPPPPPYFQSTFQPTNLNFLSSWTSIILLPTTFRIRDDFSTSLPQNRHLHRDGSSAKRKSPSGVSTTNGGEGGGSGTRLSLPPIDDDQPSHLRPRWLGQTQRWSFFFFFCPFLPRFLWPIACLPFLETFYTGFCLYI